MASLKLVLDKRRPTKTGAFPLRFRLNHLTKTAEICTGIHVHNKQFNANRQIIVDDDGLNDQIQNQRKLLETRLKEIPVITQGSLCGIQIRGIQDNRHLSGAV
jgi:integrase/recombinase XerD